MCKAGFAGDDAPRAVFRKSYPPFQQRSDLYYPAICATRHVLTTPQPLLLDVPAIMGITPNISCFLFFSQPFISFDPMRRWRLSLTT